MSMLIRHVISIVDLPGTAAIAVPMWLLQSVPGVRATTGAQEAQAARVRVAPEPSQP